MRLLYVALGAASAMAMSHSPNQARSPTRHQQLSERHIEAMKEFDRRQKTATTTDDDEGGGILGGLVGGGATDVASSTVPSTTPRVTTPPPLSVTPTSMIRSTPAVSSAISSPILGSASASASASGISATASLNGTSLASSMSPQNQTSSTPLPSSAPALSDPASETEHLTTLTTDDRGQVSVITKILTASAASDSAQSNPSPSAKPDDDNGISTGAIIGISIAAGFVVLTLIACAIWRMRRRSGDEDEAIRWPELNRHGDSTTHHALPARETGKHGFETSPLERSLSNSSSLFAPSTVAPPYSAPPMALNGSNFGATSSLEDYDYNEKAVTPPLPPLPGQAQPALGYDHDEDYANMPPPVQMHQNPSAVGGVYGGYDSEAEDAHSGHSHGQAAQRQQYFHVQ